MSWCFPAGDERQEMRYWRPVAATCLCIWDWGQIAVWLLKFQDLEMFEGDSVDWCSDGWGVSWDWRQVAATCLCIWDLLQIRSLERYDWDWVVKRQIAVYHLWGARGLGLSSSVVGRMEGELELLELGCPMATLGLGDRWAGSVLDDCLRGCPIAYSEKHKGISPYSGIGAEVIGSRTWHPVRAWTEHDSPIRNHTSTVGRGEAGVAGGVHGGRGDNGAGVDQTHIGGGIEAVVGLGLARDRLPHCVRLGCH
eukprot:gene14861-biopygen4077